MKLLSTFLSIGFALQAQVSTSLGPATSLPFSVTPNANHTLTVYITIQDPNLIPSSVNLLGISPTSQASVLGQLHDDGKNGDTIAGDGVYTIQITVNEPLAGQIQFQVSAAFKGKLKRLTSPILTVPGTSDAGLPPDPGASGTLTLAGVDSDQDGVRDDLQRFIALTYPNSAKTRGALTDMAKALQAMILAANPTDSVNSTVQFAHAYECTGSISDPFTAADLAANLGSQALNTLARSQAYLASDEEFSGQPYTLAPTAAAQKALCSFNPDLLPN